MGKVAIAFTLIIHTEMLPFLSDFGGLPKASHQNLKGKGAFQCVYTTTTVNFCIKF